MRVRIPSLVVISTCLCALPLTARETNLADNPGFEILGGDGKLLGWSPTGSVYTVSEQSPRSGTRCLRYENHDPNRYVLQGQQIRLEVGRRYQFGVWVRTEDLGGEGTGATICIQWWGPDKTFLGGAYPPGVKGTSDGWVRVSGITAPVPENADSFDVTCYVRRGGTGVATFDDVTVEPYYPPLMGAVVTDCYRDRTDGGPITVHAAVELASYQLTANDVDATIEILDARGQTAVTTGNIAIGTNQVSAVVDTTALAPGTYTVRCRVRSRDGEHEGMAETRLVRVARLAERKSYIDRHGRLILDGAPFFPLGMYWGGTPADQLDIYAQSDFNCLMPYAPISREDLDNAHRRGIRVIYSVKDLYAGRRGLADEEEAHAEITRQVNALKDHPAIMAWYINDELPISMLPALSAHRDLLEDLDPGRPTWVVLYQHGQVRQYLPTFDVIGTDPYPIPHRDIRTALQHTRNTVNGSFGARAVWQVPQVFNWASYKDGDEKRKYRSPTLEEMRCMAWQCIAGGANGLVFYSWFDLRRMSKTEAEGGRALVAEPFEERWADVRTMGAEIAELIPILLSADAPADIRMTGGQDAVAHRLYGRGATTYLVAVNTTREPAETAFSVPAKLNVQTVALGSVEPVAGHGTLTLDLEPMAVAVLELSAE